MKSSLSMYCIMFGTALNSENKVVVKTGQALVRNKIEKSMESLKLLFLERNSDGHRESNKLMSSKQVGLGGIWA
jgi:hypothetical protein